MIYALQMIYALGGFIYPKSYKNIEHVEEGVHNLLWKMKL